MSSSVTGQTEEAIRSEPYNCPKENETGKKSLLDRIVGSANESVIYINGMETSGLIDTGSMVSSISEKFYNSWTPLPQLHAISDFGLQIQSANGDELPYIEAEISALFLSN